MIDLKDALDVLYELNELRDRAKELREQARLALKQIENTRTPMENLVKFKPLGDVQTQEWISSGNSVEVALLVKVQNHKDLSDDEDENDKAEASPLLKHRLAELRLEENLFPTRRSGSNAPEDDGDRRIPVLVAARALQALVSRQQTVFSRASLLCYYRIVRELYTAAPPDWTVGAARANKGGTTAFVTGECIRAIFAFEDAMMRTSNFFRQTRRLAGRFDLLSSMGCVLESEPQVENKDGQSSRSDLPGIAGGDASPIAEWADKSIERMWFDWYISTNPREGNIALSSGDEENRLFFTPDEPADLKSVGEYLRNLPNELMQSVKSAQSEISKSIADINDYRDKEREILRGEANQPTFERRAREFSRSESAHQFALGLINKAKSEATVAARILAENNRNDALDEMGNQFLRISVDIHKVMEPARRYIRTVLHREVAASATGRFDAGELVFAAASYGAITKWKPSELLTRACTLLVNALPENGRLPTTRPFHSTPRGHRMLPIGCEMTRSFAQLLQKTTDYDLEPKLVRRMLNIFEEKAIQLDGLSAADKKRRVAWNFDGSPEPDKPCVWVTAVSVLALDRVVRMLNDRINLIIFKYFEVVRPEPEKTHSALNLNDLVYPDHGLSKHQNKPSMALRLEQMRAHVRRVTLPEIYKDEKGLKERVYSAIFYGPPGTGKTTLVEALAISSQIPLIRLSPSDLVVQGPAAIEARARFVFEALSMLTQVVIILDEFEDVVGKRAEKGKERDEKIFQFLRMGMLPKLAKLNKAARRQAFVYCLATNYLENIDVAAKRKGRFDFHIPVFDPDPISRAGLLLYRLYRLVEKISDHRNFAKERRNLPSRFLEVLELTRHAHASSLAEDYLRLPQWVIDKNATPPENYEKEIPILWYVLTGLDEGFTKKRDGLSREQKNIEAATEKFKTDLSEEEQRESEWLEDYDWLVGYEQQLSAQTAGANASLQDLLGCLKCPSAQTQRAVGT